MSLKKVIRFLSNNTHMVPATFKNTEKKQGNAVEYALLKLSITALKTKNNLRKFDFNALTYK